MDGKVGGSCGVEVKIYFIGAGLGGEGKSFRLETSVRGDDEFVDDGGAELTGCDHGDEEVGEGGATGAVVSGYAGDDAACFFKAGLLDDLTYVFG